MQPEEPTPTDDWSQPPSDDRQGRQVRPHPGDVGKKDATISLWTGIIGLVVLGVVLGTVAMVYGWRSLSQTQRERMAGQRMAVWGIALGVVDVAVFVVLLLFLNTSS